jgi:hypothetical protein
MQLTLVASAFVLMFVMWTMVLAVRFKQPHGSARIMTTASVSFFLELQSLESVVAHVSHTSRLVRHASRTQTRATSPSHARVASF